MPTRSSIKGTPTTKPEPEPMPEPQEPASRAERVVPGHFGGEDSVSWEERLGPVGITIAAVAACGAVYFIAAMLNFF